MATLPTFPQTKLLADDAIPEDKDFGGLRIVRYQTDPKAQVAVAQNQYEFQHELGKRHMIHGVVLALKGAKPNYRITATMHPTLRQFTEIVKYDPSAPPIEDWEAQGMLKAHEQTQQDFKGAKKENLANFKQYNVEAIREERVAYLPTISGWQSAAAFPETIFVALDESNPMALYGILYLPKKPVMQSDGQTQTAALFQAAQTGLAIKAGALDTFGTTLEIELNVTPERAAQSFADRNGRGSKKNKNLVATLDSSSAMARLRNQAVAGTVFEDRLADGRTGGASETATRNIADLSTMDQILLNVISRGSRKEEQIKLYHIKHFLPFCREFLELLDSEFGDKWVDPTPKGSEPYRLIYIHGWAFALKALAIAYHDCRRDLIAPLAAAIGTSAGDEHRTAEEAEELFLAKASGNDAPEPVISFEEFAQRIHTIDWLRYRKHWISLTGYKIDRNGKKKTREIKDGAGGKKLIVDGRAQNTAAHIGTVVNKILSNKWTDLTATADEPTK
ncbi:hypothetical protein [Micromonospora sp. D75]|uniref:hypothetical protein n=1 Tax=Micromonospora sp. D75 TaxID=2824885 RepID=UPI001B378A3B|nr:hypothetical protein [Micromonospora sp. D75]MBQ1065244.1 hypothetical protein [Micromonospora sp. D75]